MYLRVNIHGHAILYQVMRGKEERQLLGSASVCRCLAQEVGLQGCSTHIAARMHTTVLICEKGNTDSPEIHVADELGVFVFSRLSAGLLNVLAVELILEKSVFQRHKEWQISRHALRNLLLFLLDAFAHVLWLTPGYGRRGLLSIQTNVLAHEVLAFLYKRYDKPPKTPPVARCGMKAES